MSEYEGQCIREFFYELVKKETPAVVIEKFTLLFFDLCAKEENEDEILNKLADIIHHKDEAVFLETINLCCWILINNWSIQRKEQEKYKLLQAFITRNFDVEVVFLQHPVTMRLNLWLKSFIEGEEFFFIQLYCSPQNQGSSTNYSYYCQANHWARNYIHYLLITDSEEGIHPELAKRNKKLVKRFRRKFSNNLASYVTFYKKSTYCECQQESPTVLGKLIMTVVKEILIQQKLSKDNPLAQKFKSNMKRISYQKFKECLLDYLFYKLKDQITPEKFINIEEVESSPKITPGELSFIDKLRTNLASKLKSLYSNYNRQKLNSHLFIDTCNWLIDYLTFQDGEPANMFIKTMAHGFYRTLTIIFLRLADLCHYCHSHLEKRIADLIKYSKSGGEWLIHFLDIFQVGFAMFFHNEIEENKKVLYEIIKLGQGQDGEQDLNSYRVFISVKRKFDRAYVIESMVRRIVQLKEILLDSGLLPQKQEKKAIRCLESVEDEVQEQEPDEVFVAKNLKKVAEVVRELESGTSLQLKCQQILTIVESWFGVAFA